VSYGSAGNGSTEHLSGEMFRSRAGVDSVQALQGGALDD